MNYHLVIKEKKYGAKWTHISINKQTIKLLIVMKTTLLLILLFSFQASAKLVAQSVSISLKNVSFSAAMDEISKQTSYEFAYNKKILNRAKPVTVNLQKATLEEALRQLFHNQPFKYTINDRVIIIVEERKPEKTLFETKKSELQQEQQDPVRGRVTDSIGNPLANVTVRVHGTNISTMTDKHGYYELLVVEKGAQLSFSFIGYDNTVKEVNNNVINVILHPVYSYIDEVVVNTGYQSLPKERATGSFVVIDSALLQRSVSTNILERLDGITSSLIFNKSGGFNTPDISIRGRSTILGNPEPLVVVDNFPYDGDINTLNPNDVESITVLKDAAAASIWGTRAGNGVIVITTKSGKFNQNTKINFNSNVTIGQKPRLYTQKSMSSAEYIEVETDMFDRGRYDATINNGYAALSPAVEILLMHRSGGIDLVTRNKMLDSLAEYDSRDDLLKYFYQVPVNQQYNLNISGGGTTQKFYLSAGYDRNLMQNVGSSYERLTLNGQNTYRLFNDKVQWASGIQFTTDKNKSAPVLPTNLQWLPYVNIADESGTALPFARDLRFSYIEAQHGKGLLDWYYRPLDERRPATFNNSYNFRLQNNLTFNIAKPLKVIAFHSYQKGIIDNSERNYQDSYYTRNLINSISSIDPETGFLERPIAQGEILESTKGTMTSQYGRIQAIFNETFGLHNINGIVGAEVSEYKIDYSLDTRYGYNPETGSNTNSSIDYNFPYPYYTSAGSYYVPIGIGNSREIDRNVSYYINASYTYRETYTVTASARKDKSNIFGVNSNQKGVPLWSIGGLWHISNEYFYNLQWLPKLSIRATYGYNGNVDKTTSAYFTTRLIYNNLYGYPQYQVANPPNPSLRWEKVNNVNLGVDFSTKDNRISGAIELYKKHGIDLIGISPIAPQAGITEFRGNNANLKTKGFDIMLNGKILTGSLNWHSSLLMNYVKDEVTHYEAEAGGNSSIVGGGATSTPLVGYPYNSIFSYKWAGLDETGAPQGFLEGNPSIDYTAIANSKDRNELVFNGSRNPTLFGSLRNTFAYKNLQLSFLISYKSGHVFRKSFSLNNSNLYGTVTPIYTSNPDYKDRWKQPGDELNTNVPSLIYPANSRRDNQYQYSEILVYSANHIRLQDVRLSYLLNSQKLKTNWINQLEIFCYANNLGILWKANDIDVDPDSPNIKQTSSLALGASLKF